MTARKDPYSRYYIDPAITDQNKVTVKLHHNRLCFWPGNVQNWIHPDRSGEYSVDGVPCVGHVAGTRVAAERVLPQMPAQVVPVLRQGMPVVIRREQLPANLREVV